MKYYGLATSKEGKNHVVYLQETLYPAAQREAKEKCEVEGLTFQELRLVGGKETKGSTLTKYAEARKRRGQL